MTITQTIDVPPDRRVTLPKEVPAGAIARVDVTWQSAEMDETKYLLKSAANREHLLRSIKEAEEGKVTFFDSLDDLDKATRPAKQRKAAKK